MNPDYNFITSQLGVSESAIKSIKTRTTSDSVIYEITLKRMPMNCPLCGGIMIGHGHKTKTINHPVLRNHQGTILYHANRYICKNCGKTAIEPNPFAIQGFNSSNLMLQSVMTLLGNLNFTLDSISKELNISPTQVNTYLDSFVTIPKLPLPESLGIDELHTDALSGKNSNYLCVLVDNKNRCVYDILNSRSKYTLEKYFADIPRADRHRVKYVTIDMWAPYRDVAATFFPNAVIAVDPFHVVEHLCKGFDRLRLNLMNACDYRSNGYYLLKKWNWLLTKDGVDLDNKRVFNHRFGVYLNRRDIRDLIFETFPSLHTAYQLKEYYRKFNKEASFEDACCKFDDIIKIFSDSGIREYDEFTNILFNWRTEILNSFMRPYDDCKLSNSFTENVNGKLRTYLTVSRGLTNFRRFRKRALYALNPKTQYYLTGKLYSEKRVGKKRGHYNKIHE